MSGGRLLRTAGWAVLVLLVAVLFGIVVLDTERGEGHFGGLGRAAVLAAETPWTVRELLSEKSPMAAMVRQNYDGQSGWKVVDAAAGDGLEGYLLLSRYDGDRARHVVELVSLPDLAVKHRWEPDADALLEGVPQTSPLAEYTLWNTQHYRVIHPVLFPNGDLLVKDHQSVLFRISACAAPVWREASLLYHHSSEADAEGMLWVPSYAEPSTVKGALPDFHDDLLVQLSPDGEILYRKSLVEAFTENGLFPVVFTAGTYQSDPLHLNDIQPVLEDGPYWKKGDLFLSLRHRSMLLLYRPSTNEIVWSKVGPWMAQHDVDILDDHRIAVFNNNAYDTGQGGYVRGHSQLMVYDFATGAVSTEADATMASEKVVTQSEGLADRTPQGQVIVEQENAGRLLILAPDGRVFATFVNAAGDGVNYRMGWSRYVPGPLGDQALQAIGATACGSAS